MYWLKHNFFHSRNYYSKYANEAILKYIFSFYFNIQKKKKNAARLSTSYHCQKI